jgi:hypothetical protein
VGTCTLTASATATANYNQATGSPQSFAVGKATQTITFGPIASQNVGTPLTLSATASSGLTVSFTSTTTTVCTVSGTSATFLTTGTCTINANQAGNSTYAAAATVPRSFTVNPYTLSIISLSVNSGVVGTQVTITGTNFGATQLSSKVKFNGITVTDYGGGWGNTQIVVKVPQGATTGNVVVYVGTSTSNGVAFTVPLSITTISLPTGVQNVSYSTALQAGGGQPPYTWSYSGNLPVGLQLSASGAITGTPIWSGTNSFTAKVTDAAQSIVNAGLSITVTPVVPPSTTSSVGYTYDSQGRVHTATYTTPSGTVTVTYSYDNAGNRTTVVTQ